METYCSLNVVLTGVEAFLGYTVIVCTDEFLYENELSYYIS